MESLGLIEYFNKILINPMDLLGFIEYLVDFAHFQLATCSQTIRAFPPFGEPAEEALVALAERPRRAAEVFDGGVAPHTELLAQILVLVFRAVHVDNDHVLRPGECVSELVPSGLHPLAVASPRREELDESGLAGLFGGDK